MAASLEGTFLSNRLRSIEERFEGPTTFGKCDCTSYSYLVLSMILFTIGTAITILALGDSVDTQVFPYLGNMWLVGPMFICSGFMVAVKCILYLRRKSVIRLICHQQQFWESCRVHQSISNSGIGTLGPPSYEIITQTPCTAELPPPTYAEAVALLQQAGIHDAKPSCVSAPEGDAPEDGAERTKP